MNNSIYPCITLKNQVTQAANFYIDVFGNGKIGQTSPWVVQIELSGQKIMLLNDGPTSKPNASISFMVMNTDTEETEKQWNKLITDGHALMPLNSYPWSSRYGWVQDKYGVSWQLYTSEKGDTTQRICPTFMFTGKNLGKATEAIHFYTELFPDSKIEGIMNYSEEEGENIDFVKHAQFKLNNYTFMAMDSSMEHGFDFNDAVSIVVECADQAEIDKYWNILSSEGGREVACGWLTDKYGVCWQIIPQNIAKLISDPERAQRVMPVMMKMKKLVIADLENA